MTEQQSEGQQAGGLSPEQADQFQSDATEMHDQLDAATESDVTAESQEESENGTSWDPERAKEKIRKINSENRSLRERANKAEEKAASAEELATQKNTLENENLRLRVGYELGLPLALAARLQGATREELIADAGALVDLVSPSRPAPATGRPTASLRPGATAEPLASSDAEYASMAATLNLPT